MSTPFVLPEGLSLAMGGNSLVIRHSGDIVLEQTLGRKLSRVEAGGDLTLRCGPVTGALLAQGVLRTERDVDADELRAREIIIGGAEIKARAIVALDRVVIGKANLDIDVVVAPEVIIDPEATGRIRVLDCFNDRPPLRVRGCLSLEEFEADFGGAAEFLARRGVIPVNPLPSSSTIDEQDDSAIALDDAETTQETAVIPRQVPGQLGLGRARGRLTGAAARVPTSRGPALPPLRPPRPEPPREQATDTDAEETARVPVPEATVAPETRPGNASPARPEPPAAPEPPARPEPVATRPEPSADPSATPVAAANTPRAPVRRDLSRHEARIRRTVQRVVASYDGEAPEAVVRMSRLTDAGQFDDLAANLDGLWTETLRAHLDRGAQPPRQVITSFHALYALIYT